MAQSVSPPVVDPAIRVEIQRGAARVIVRLRLPGGFRPEGELSGPAAVAAQRAAIAAGQQEVLSRLAGAPFSVVHTYATTPFMALEVSPGALAALELMGDIVLGVTLDDLAAPSGAPAVPARP